jgi:CheY-like chemotaxis protein/HPt (histidine-containing phosphotransfer) domain-containing protein
VQAVSPATDRALAGLRVLAVDDNATNRAILREQMRSWGCQNETVPTAAEALERLRAASADGSPFRLVLADVQMPEMDGLMLTSAIKGDPRLQGTPVILLSSAGDSLDEETRLRLGVSACLVKPVREARLKREAVRAVNAGIEIDGIPETPPARLESVKLGLKILVAEDNDVNREVARGILSRLGCTPHFAVNGREAVEAFQREPFDLILMDVQMPEMDGLEATERIRSLEHDQSGAHIPIIAMTAHNMRGDREIFLARGMDAYVPKPVDTATLLATLRVFASQIAPETERAGAAEAPPPAQPPKPAPVSSFEPAVLDIERLQMSSGGRTDREDKLIRMFLSSASERMEHIMSTLDAGDMPAVLTEAHTLKGSSRTLGATALGEACARLEQAVKDGEGIEAAAGALRLAWPPAEQAFTARLDAIAAERIGA